jgi:hypothetical protein
LSDLLRKNQHKQFTWGEQQQQAFDELKRRLTSAPVLASFNPNADSQVRTDASNVGIGAVIEQKSVSDGTWKPIAYTSRRLTRTEENYTTRDKELLAIIHALKTWRHYLLTGKHFRILTDHKSLKHFQTQPTLNQREARWAEVLAEFDTEIIYAPGESNSVADSLSRYPCLNNERVTPTESPTIQAMNSSTIDISQRFKEEIKSALRKDPHFEEIVKILEENISNHSIAKRFVLHEGLVYLKDENRLCIPEYPKKLRLQLLKEIHDTPIAGHLGVTKTYQTARKLFFWPKMELDIEDYISCEKCQRNKSSNHPTSGLLQPLPITSQKWESISMDLITHLPKSRKGNDAIVVFWID